MSEIRQDQATKRWVVIATERAKRPHDLVTPKTDAPPPQPYVADCPFCERNEDKTPPEIMACRDAGTAPNTPGWQIRIVPNRFAALSPGPHVEVRDREWFTSVSGTGAHEVVVESPRHDANPATMTPGDLARVLVMVGERFEALAQDPNLGYVAIFRNNGLAAGSSLTHPHSQIIATPVVPTNVRSEIEEARRHFDDRLYCVYCETIEREIEAGVRVVIDSHDYVVYEPFASRWPFETWILPKRHAPIFAAGTREDVEELSRVLQDVLHRLYAGLGNPAYNLVLHETPLRDSCEDYYHWHIEILPRLSTAAGFELGTGIWINSVLPEEAAAFLRDQ